MSAPSVSRENFENGLTRTRIRAPFSGRDQGFTLIELVVVMVIVGILATFAIGRMDFQDTFNQKGVRDKTVAALQFARKTAVARRRNVCVSFAANTIGFSVDPTPPECIGVVAATVTGTCPTLPYSASICAGTPAPVALNLPSPDTSCGSTTASAVHSCTGSTISSASGNFQFDPQGGANATVTYSVTGQPNITVEGTTGYVR